MTLAVFAAGTGPLLPSENSRLAHLAISELATEQSRVDPLAREEISMTALLENFSAIDHHHTISTLHRAQSVRDDQRRSPLKQLLHRFFNEPLTLAVETRCCLVEN